MGLKQVNNDRFVRQIPGWTSPLNRPYKMLNKWKHGHCNPVQYSALLLQSSYAASILPHGATHWPTDSPLGEHSTVSKAHTGDSHSQKNSIFPLLKTIAHTSCVLIPGILESSFSMLWCPALLTITPHHVALCVCVKRTILLLSGRVTIGTTIL